MSHFIDRRHYADLYGPTTGDRVRLGDTNLWATVERDLTHYGDECVFGGGKAKVSSDDGRKWSPSSATEAPKHDPRARVEVGGFVLEASEDGVKRRASSAAPYTAEVVLRPTPPQPK